MTVTRIFFGGDGDGDMCFFGGDGDGDGDKQFFGGDDDGVGDKIVWWRQY